MQSEGIDRACSELAAIKQCKGPECDLVAAANGLYCSRLCSNRNADLRRRERERSEYGRVISRSRLSSVPKPPKPPRQRFVRFRVSVFAAESLSQNEMARAVELTALEKTKGKTS